MRLSSFFVLPIVLIILILFTVLSGCIEMEPRTEHVGIINDVTFTESNRFYVFLDNYTSHALITGDSNEYKFIDAYMLANQHIGHHVRFITESNQLQFFETLD